MDSSHIILTDAPTADELGAIRRPLDRFNFEACGIADQRPLALLVRDPASHEVVGGLNGRTTRGILFVDVFFLPESMRGAGLGSKLLRMAEEEGSRRGCFTGILYTNSFQAPEFYMKQGWREFGRFPSIPSGTSRIFFCKELVPA
ncbi:GNAT family N-acetyltransferase [Dyella sp.]|jgi:GNAT superfamily N-acetyltransferase|uniref:GNAT family N-acetyltransferase n=1 Tax=Dyella sp. TaxID=1869338 RepID=UPI002FDB52CD